ncbi:ATP-binding protein [Desulfobotulus sp. H1]|uniref:histidine kinase n=1 Tax=Desulfobotulus pelophilus TaxID=2823377 RepID=A0ABT3NEE2_9BACT|nr:ATP-binding protein [Desulfobotulus pelophilus]MCW7755267.1 ATP-binding protein [Desulfobotulus pelophilus]
MIQDIFSKLPLQSKMMVAMILTGGATLTVAVSFFLINDIILLRKNFEREISLITELVSNHSFPTLYFENPEAASLALESLRARDDMITAAALYLPSGRQLATYYRDETTRSRQPMLLPAHPPIPGRTSFAGGFTITKEISYMGKPIGKLLLHMDHSRYHKQIRWYALLSLAILFSAGAMAYIFSMRLRKILLNPIFQLVQTVEKITEKKDYAIRAPVFNNDEIGVLISGFNNMIQEIQERDKALLRHRATLQQEIMDRTMALMAANTKLTRLNIKLQEAKKRDLHLLRHRENLEQQVLDRTVALTATNTKLIRLNMELREAKKRADEASSAKSAFLASISHELRTPLNGILGYAQLLYRDGERLGTRDQERIQVIRQCGEHLLRMINDILDLSKIEAGKMSLILHPFHLSTFVQSTAGMARTRAREKGLSMEISVAECLPKTVIGDEHRLRQVLLNLLGNAVKFTERGSVSLRVSTQKGLIVFEVADTGMGIQEEDLEIIFSPFSQVESVRRKPEGTGLGLSISQSLVRMMGGVIKVESSLGNGSRFWFAIRLPQAPEKIPGEKNFSSYGDIIGYRRTDEGARPLSILVVDDGKENRTFLVELFAPLGFMMEEADCGTHALDSCRTSKPDLILMDLIMPGMDGFETTRRIHRLFDGDAPPVIAVSASATHDVREKCLDMGCAAFISKPVQIQELFEVLCRHLPLVWISESLHLQPPDFADIPFPETERMQKLMNLVKQGDISAIGEWCQSQDLNTHYATFAGHVKELASQFRIRELSQWLTRLGKARERKQKKQ